MAGVEQRVDAWGDPIGPKELPPLIRIAEDKALDICLRTPLSAKSKGLLQREHTPSEYLHCLLEESQYSDIAHFLAQALPKPLAVRWARGAAFFIEEFNQQEEVKEAFSLIDAWLKECEERGFVPNPREQEGDDLDDPRDQMREKAAELAQALNFKPPSAWVLMAIANSVPAKGADKPELYRPMTGQSAATAVVIAAASGGEPLIMDHDDQYIEFLQDLIAQGVHLAAGGDGEVDRELLEPYFIDDDPVLGRTKDRVLNLEEMIAQAERANQGAAAAPPEPAEDDDGEVTLLRIPSVAGVGGGGRGDV